MDLFYSLRKRGWNGKALALIWITACSLKAFGGTVADVDELSTWNCKHDLDTDWASAGTTVLSTLPARDGLSRSFDISWTGFGGERCSAVLPALDTVSTHFTFDLWFRFTDISDLRNIEIDHNQVLANGQTVIFGTQCVLDVGRWKYSIRNGTAAIWKVSNATCGGATWTSNTWHHLIEKFHRVGGIVTYDSVEFDGAKQDYVGASGDSSFALGWGPLGRQVVNFQLGGGAMAGSTIAYLDSFTVIGSVVTPLPSAPTGLTAVIQ